MICQPKVELQEKIKKKNREREIYKNKIRTKRVKI